MSLAVDANGNVQANALYAPYGSVRYQSGTMPTDYGYTGQHSDSVTGLDYYNARYYDPLAQQFTSADTVLPGNGYDLWGLSRYAYVEGNPETRTDPTGHRVALDVGGGLSDLNAGITAAQFMIGFGTAVRHYRPLYVQLAKNSAKASYTAAKNAAQAAQHADGDLGGLSKAELRQLASERNASVRAAEDTADCMGSLTRWTKGVGWGLTIAGGAVDGILSGFDQWNHDASGHYSTGQRWARAVTAGAVHGIADAAIGYGTSELIAWGVTAAVGVLFAETGPADPLLMTLAFSATTAIAAGGGAAVVTNALAPVVNTVSDAAANFVGSLFS